MDENVFTDLDELIQDCSPSEVLSETFVELVDIAFFKNMPEDMWTDYYEEWKNIIALIIDKHHGKEVALKFHLKLLASCNLKDEWFMKFMRGRYPDMPFPEKESFDV